MATPLWLSSGQKRGARRADPAAAQRFAQCQKWNDIWVPEPPMLDAAEVEAEWSSVLRTVRAGMLAVPSRCAARLPHLTPHDVAEIDAEVRAVLTDVGGVG